MTSNKIGSMEQARPQRDQLPLVIQTENLESLKISKNRKVNEMQQKFCSAIIDCICLDESSELFSKPVEEIWNSSALIEYFKEVKRPMDLGTIRKRTFSCHYNINDESTLFDPNKYREEVRLVFLNAVSFNGEDSEIGRLAKTLLQYTDTEFQKFPQCPSKHGDEKGVINNSNTEQKIDHVEDCENEGPDDNVFGDGERDGGGNVQDRKPIERSSADGDAGSDVNMDLNPKCEENDEGTGSKSHEVIIEITEINKSEDRIGLEREISRLSRAKSRALTRIVELELLRKIPCSKRELVKFRDEVEAAPWEILQKVSNILHTYVDDAKRDCGENDPDYVTIDITMVDPKLLTQIISLIHPDSRIENAKRVLVNVERKMDNVRRKLNILTAVSNLNGGSSSSLN